MFVTGSNVQSNQLPWVTFFLLIANVAVFAKSYTLECQAATRMAKGWMGCLGSRGRRIAFASRSGT